MKDITLFGEFFWDISQSIRTYTYTTQGPGSVLLRVASGDQIIDTMGENWIMPFVLVDVALYTGSKCFEVGVRGLFPPDKNVCSCLRHRKPDRC